MAISRDKKQQIVGEVSRLLKDSKLTVIATYEGLSVADAQELRRSAAADGTTVKVVKNRLVKVAMGTVERFKDTDAGVLNGQLLYAFNPEDETAAARNLSRFAKDHPALQPLAGLSADGSWLDAAQVKALAELPDRDTLRAQLVGTLSAPLSGILSVLSGPQRGLVNVLKAHADNV